MMNMSVMRMTSEHCMYEERFSTLEREVAELKARMDSKKDNIQSINDELVNDRRQQIELIEKVTEVTVLLRAGQQQRKENNKKMDMLEQKVDNLQNELTETKEQITDLIASQRSFRNTVVVGVPIIIGVMGLVFHFI